MINNCIIATSGDNTGAPFFAIYGRDGRDGPDGRWRESMRHGAGRNGLRELKMTPSVFPSRKTTMDKLSSLRGNTGP